MKILEQIALIFLIWLISDFIGLYIPLPSGLIGMILLFLILKTKLLKVEFFNDLSDFMLKNLAFFFIPPGVMILKSLDIIKANIIPLSVIILISTIIVMALTSLVVQFLAERFD
ncbi:MAG: CidA/LrgA family protein [Peptostreptococcaceae bacterium]|jgi:holin-like protein|nr:CidA/LrgA family protein [Peptostreptococcaceae bacterium]